MNAKKIRSIRLNEKRKADGSLRSEFQTLAVLGLWE
jgi:hypothetical protein